MTEEKKATETTGPGGSEASLPEDDFGAMFAKENKMPVRLKPGQKIKATVISISKDMVYVDLDEKSEGVIELAEFKGADGTWAVKEGDEIEAFFLHVRDGAKRLTTIRHGYSTLDLAEIRAAHQANLPVSGKVKGDVKGGFEVTVGSVRCFCPFSQIDLKRDKDSETYVGQTFPFKVVEFEEESQNIVLSRRVLFEEERQAQADRIKETLVVGTDLTGTVRSLANFGAFVDIGGIDGLIPMSELAWDRTGKAEDVLSPGQEVKVRVIGIDWEKGRLTLSLKALQADPWETAAAAYRPGSRVKGPVVRLTAFGAFVNLAPGIDGLIHISNFGTGKRINHPKDVVAVGQVVEPYVTAVDPVKRKISLSLETPSEEEESYVPEAGAPADTTSGGFGSFGELMHKSLQKKKKSK
jgi:small subunit ribosomal protein S1